MAGTPPAARGAPGIAPLPRRLLGGCRATGRGRRLRGVRRAAVPSRVPARGPAVGAPAPAGQRGIRLGRDVPDGAAASSTPRPRRVRRPGARQTPEGLRRRTSRDTAIRRRDHPHRKPQGDGLTATM